MNKKGLVVGVFAAIAIAVLVAVSVSAFGTNPLTDRQPIASEQKSDNAKPEARPRQGAAKAPAAQEPALDANALGKAEMASVSKISLRDQDVLERNKPIVVSFSAPMVSQADLNALVKKEDMPIILDPPVEGEGRWLNQNSFAFVAAKPGFEAGKQYFMRFRDGLKALDGKPARYFLSFRTKFNQVRKVELSFLDKNSFELPVFIQFSEPIAVEALKERLSVKDGQSGEALDFEIEPRETLSSGHGLRLKLGKQRDSVILSLRKDQADDKAPLGLAEAYERTLRPGLSAPVADPAKTARDSDVAISSFNSWEDSRGQIQARFYLTKSIAPHNQNDFIKLSPDIPYTLGSNNSSIHIREGLEPGMQITLTLEPGLTDNEGDTLKKKLVSSQTIGDRRAAARFLDEGHLLTPAYGERLGIAICNVDQVSVQVFRQYENNLPLMSLRPEYFVKNLMRDLYHKEIRIKDLKRNVVEKRAIDLAELTKGKKGVYRVVLEAYAEEKYDGGSYMSYEGSTERIVIISDVGAAARVFPSGVSVFAASLSTAEPIADALVKVYSRSNQLIASGKAGADGVYVHQRAAAWDSQLQPGVVTVQTGEGDDMDLAFLPLDYQTESQQSDKGVRPYLDKGYEAFVYTPRGVFRPGETVDVKAFVRDKDQLPPAPFPVLFKVVNSRNTEIARSSSTLSLEGGADFSFALPASAATGQYYVRLEVPGQASPTIGTCSFKVEDFTPPRIEVGVTPQGEVLLGEQEMPVALSARYLFGAPGADLKYELGYKVSKKAFSPEGYDGYAFGDFEKRFTVESNLKHMEGKLGADGLGRQNFKAPADWDGSHLLHTLLVLSVQEDGGRWVSKTSAIDYFPKAYLLGLKTETANAGPGEKVALSVAAVAPDGESADPGRLSVEISRIQSNWHTVYRDGRNVHTWEERLIALEARQVESSEGKASFSFTPPQSGRYLIRAASQDGAVVATRRIGVWGHGREEDAEGSGRMDLVELSLDKTEYKAGETARLSIKAPFAGTLFLGIERGGQMLTRTLRMQEPAVTQEILVTKEMSPNVSITAWVVRPLKEKNKEWFSHRAQGHATLLLSREPHKLMVTAETPKRATPSKPLAVPFTVSDAEGNPIEGEFSVALIDEGILSLTMFKTPDPLSFFMAQRYMVGRSFDAYDALLKPEARAFPLLAAGGGGAADYQGSLSTEQVFLTAYLPTVRTDASGKAVAQFDIPEYSGKGRLMIVGASGARFASAETQVRVARDLAMESSAPRAVAPGDSFDLSLKLFALTTEEGDKLTGAAKARISAEGPVTLSGETEKSIELAPQGGASSEAQSMAVRAKAGDAAGVIRYTVEVEVPGRPDQSFSKNFETVVRPPYPRSAFTVSRLVPAGGKETLEIPGKWLPGSERLSFSIDSSPVMAVLPALEFLREYPYGCLEQTVSRAWPYLTLDEIQSALRPDKEADKENNLAVLAGAVNRVCNMMTLDGGFGLWPGYSTSDPWRSVNAIFFLHEAKAKVSVPPAVFNKALDYLRFILAAPVEHFYSKAYGYSTKAYAAFVLTKAGQAPLSWLQSLSEHEKTMFPSGRIFLAAAKALKSGNSSALKALDGEKLAIDGRISNNESLESNLRNTSLLLYAWSLVDPADKRAAELSVKTAEELGKRRWFTPQDSGMAALALGVYIEKTGAGAGKGYTAAISLDGKPLEEISDGGRKLIGNERLPMTGNAAPKLTAALGPEGPAYCVYSMRGVPMEPPAPRSSDLAVQRVWKDAEGKVIDLSSGEVKVKRGDRITVELTVKSAYNVSDVVVSDLTPGGMEVENPRLAASTAGAGGENGEKYGMYVDQREDRLLVFLDRLSGQITYSYSMRAVSRGVFALPPLAADCMYEPEVNAVTSAGSLIVE